RLALGLIEQQICHFQSDQCYTSYSETLKTSTKYPIESFYDPFKMCSMSTRFTLVAGVDCNSGFNLLLGQLHALIKHLEEFF
uniref:Uncharacterized protein n=1 Tax=Cyprinodon variegatus TaxID=28743 RepID=A0A3Q2EG64_CYPVA